MDKIFFNDDYCMTDLVLDGLKNYYMEECDVSIIREINYLKSKYFDNENFDKIIGKNFYRFLLDTGHMKARFHRGDQVAIGISYSKLKGMQIEGKINYDIVEQYNKSKQVCLITNHAGWLNREYVDDYLMPFRILIKSVSVKRLKELEFTDMLNLGLMFDDETGLFGYMEANKITNNKKSKWISKDITAAFKAMIEGWKGADYWDKNPLLFVYWFKLISDLAFK